MAILNFTTSGVMTIELQGARFGEVRRDVDRDPNVKRFDVDTHRLSLEVHDEKNFSSWGAIEIVEEGTPGGVMTVTIDTNAVGWFGSAQFTFHYDNGQHRLSDNFQSETGGIPNSGRSKRYNIRSFN